jgi:SAM-dependent methyltransferase
MLSADSVGTKPYNLRRPMLQSAKNAVVEQIRKVQKRRMIASGGAPASFYDHTYSDYADLYGVHYSTSKYLAVWGSICERIPQGARILEVGCGPAQFAHMVLDKGIPGDYVGFDFSPGAIEMAKKNVPGRRVEVGDARTTDLFTSVNYDTVVCTEVLEHIVDDVPVLERIPRGKHVLATVPDFDDVSHVRFFASADEVRQRYGSLFTSLKISEHYHAGDTNGSGGTFFLMDGER